MHPPSVLGLLTRIGCILHPGLIVHARCLVSKLGRTRLDSDGSSNNNSLVEHKVLLVGVATCFEIDSSSGIIVFGANSVRFIALGLWE